jgi:DNA-binding NarL/FixJ family response regulator
VGVEQARAFQPDVVILDLAMPFMDGVQALPLILAAVPDTKVVVYSGSEGFDLRDSWIHQGAVAVVPKHKSIEVLIDTIDQLLGDRMPV